MSEKDDGGPAFPFPTPVWMKPRDADGPITRLPDSVQPGMSLRDYFAAHALEGLIASGGTFNGPSHGDRGYEAERVAPTQAAYRAYEYAAAMLKVKRERE